ncbi:MAG: YafY family transcriptional regulator [Myxococcaceae bacterium]|nr:YafY family transcriptional regulator [Myxococcaceae bacterium]
MSKTSVRVLKLLAVLQSKADWSGGGLAERLEVDVRTLRRDMNRLRELGYEIESSSGVGGGYRLGAGSVLPPLRLDDEEAVTLSIALASLNASQPHLHEVALRVLVKLSQVLPARLRRRVSDVQAVTLSMGQGQHVKPTVLAELAAGCRDHERVAFGYADGKGATGQRDVEPLKLVHTGRTWYLVAWDPSRADWRTFRVDRIDTKQVVRRGPRFVPRRPPDDLEAYVKKSLAAAPYAYQVSVRLQVPLDEARRRVPSWLGSLEAEGAKHTRLTTGGPTLDAMAALLVHAGVAFDDVQPASLAAAIHEVGERLVRGAARAKGARR